MSRAAGRMTIAGRMIETASRARMLLSEDARDAIVRFIEGRLCANGAYAGRSGTGDLYYTVFALQALLALDSPVPGERVWEFACGFGAGAHLDLVHLACLVRVKSLLEGPMDAGEAAGFLSSFRSADGAFAARQGAGTGSVYASFLAVAAHEDAGLEVPDAAGVYRAFEALRSADGGFANEPGMEHGTTSATAAGVVVQRALGGGAEDGLSGWLLARLGRDGGFRASPRTSSGDLLSTATALHALCLTGVDLRHIAGACLDFVTQHWDGAGGFFGHAAEQTPDCEYTFYGLLALGSLACAGAGP